MLTTGLFISVSAQSTPNKDSQWSKEFAVGFEKFNGYQAPWMDKMTGWRIMLETAEKNGLAEKLTVAEYAAGFVSINVPEEGRSFFKPQMDLALRYFREGIKQGNARAMLRLAQLYGSGIGEPRNAEESVQELLLESATKGNKEAMGLLAERFLYGHGVDRDLFKASEWQYKASSGSQESSVYLDQNGFPKVQDSRLLDEFARVLSVMVRARDHKDAAALAELKRLEKEDNIRN